MIISDPHFEQFWTAISSGDEAKQRFAIQVFRNINATNSKGETLVIRAARKVHIAALRYLVANGADVHHRTLKGSTALFEASRTVHARAHQAIQILLEAGANPNAPGENELSPLAATAQSEEILLNMQVLINRGAAVNQQSTKKGVFPFFQAASCNNVPGMAHLLKNGAEIDKVTPLNETSIFTAIDNRSFEAARFLLEHHANLNIAAKFESPIEPTPLYQLISSYRGKQDEPFLKLLLKHGAIPGYSVGVAVQQGLLSVLKIFQEFGHDWNAPCGPNGMRPIHIPCRVPRIEITNWLHFVGAEPSIPDNEGNTALHHACSYGTEVAFDAIINHMDGIDDQNNQGATALALTCVSRSITLCQKLLQQGADVDLPANDGVTPLQLAATMWDFAKILLTYGADVNAQAGDGSTPLLIAAQDGNDRCVELLLRNGANPLLPRKDGVTPLFTAHRFHHKKCVFLILEAIYGASKDLRKVRVLRDLLIPGTNLRVVTFEPEFVEPAPDVYTPPAENEVMSGMRYLQEQGFSKEQIGQMRQPVAAQEEVKPIMIERLDLAALTWFGGALKGNNPYVRQIEGNNKCHNCFLYLAPECQREPFTTMVMKFAAANGEQGIKRLKGFVHSFTLDFQGKLYPMRFTDEVKTLASEERLLCSRHIADDGNTTLLIACQYLPNGLHVKNVKQGLPKSVVLRLSLNNESEVTGR